MSCLEPWIELSCEVPQSLAEPCSDFFESLGAVSVSFFETGDEPILEPLPGTTPLWERVKVVALFPVTQDLEHVTQAFQAAYPMLPFALTPLVEQDWTRTWLQHFRPLCFGQQLWILPRDMSPAEQQAALQNTANPVVIYLDPGLAFGTGTHPTTALCLRWLDGHPPVHQQVIDYGCGSGILGIAALKLGARQVLAVDYDPQALLATRDNGLQNNVDPEQLLTHSPERSPSDYSADLILANILAEPLITLAPRLAQHCVLGGKIVLSGLLARQSESLQSAYAPWFHFAPPIEQEGWILLEGTRYI